MATTPSNPTHLRTPMPPTVVAPELEVTTVTPFAPSPSRKSVLRAVNLPALSKEPEDARLTGGTRSLDRRLLALNLSGPHRKVKVEPDRSANRCVTAA